MNHWTCTAALTLTLVACAESTPGAKPLDMSANDHDAMAAAHDSEATAHGGRYNPNASKTVQRCAEHRTADVGLSPCWTDESNPTDAHISMAEAHRKMAADHRAASAALRNAEATSCAGVSDEDRDESPLRHTSDILSVNGLRAGGRGNGTGPGATVITIRPVMGLTVAYLQRIIDCHLARNAAMGFDMPEMGSCPLYVKGVSATVQSAEDGFQITIASPDSAAANEVLRRAKAEAGGLQ